MLAPDDRSLLADLLVAPDGYRLEHAVATTFTLDLTALLMVPLGFAGTDLRADASQLALLQAVREYSDRIDVFCQSGYVKVPTKYNRLLGFVESIVHPVPPPETGGLFHPKIWVLRFAPHRDNEDQTSRFRLICGSRNLTFDRSWDAAIVLDGVERNRRFAYNNPLFKFVDSLSARAGGLTSARQYRMGETVAALPHVEWSRLPDTAEVDEWLQFHSFGTVKSAPPDSSGDQILVVSPFVNAQGVMQFEPTNSLQIISRSEELNSLEDEGRSWVSDDMTTLFTLNDDAAIRDFEDTETGLKWELTGLHAKFYVFERGSYTHIMVGSANATSAAWQKNDEFLIEILGKRKTYGIDSLIGEGSDFRKLLLEHSLSEPPAVDPDEDLRKALEAILRTISMNRFKAVIGGSDEEGWIQTVSSLSPVSISAAGVESRIGLVTLPSQMRELISTESDIARWDLGGLEEATPFIVISLSKGAVSVSTVVLASLEGGPADRLDRVLASQFSDADTFLRFIALLLALAGGDESLATQQLLDGFGEGSGAWTSSGAGLLEAALRALSRSPRSVDDVERLVTRLRSTARGRAILPEGWDEVWLAILDARRQLKDDHE